MRYVITATGNGRRIPKLYDGRNRSSLFAYEGIKDVFPEPRQNTVQRKLNGTVISRRFWPSTRSFKSQPLTAVKVGQRIQRSPFAVTSFPKLDQPDAKAYLQFYPLPNQAVIHGKNNYISGTANRHVTLRATALTKYRREAEVFFRYTHNNRRGAQQLDGYSQRYSADGEFPDPQKQRFQL